MRVRDLYLTERDQPRRRVEDIILDRYEQDHQNLFATYTVIDKVGINPRSGYNTPLGIYCYPMAHVIKTIKNSGASGVEYMGDSPYITVFRAVRPERGMDLAAYTDQDYDRDLSRLRDYFVNRRSWLSDSSFDNTVNQAVYHAHRSANQTAANMWNITRTLADHVGSRRLAEWSDTRQAQRSSVVWNGILRNILGYDYAVDPRGYGIIHTAEPTQAVFFSKPALRSVDQLRNTAGSFNYQITLINRIKNPARQQFEMDRLIGRNINNRDRYAVLRQHMRGVQDPGVQVRLIRREMSNFFRFDQPSESAREFMMNRIVRQFADPEKTQKFFNDLQWGVGQEAFFRKLGVNQTWPEFEAAVLPWFDEISYGAAGDAAIYYAVHIKPQRWTAIESHIRERRDQWPEYRTRFELGSSDQDWFKDDHVMIAVKPDQPQQIAQVTKILWNDAEMILELLEDQQQITVSLDHPGVKLLTDQLKREIVDQLPYRMHDTVTVNTEGKDLTGTVDSVMFPWIHVSVIKDDYPQTKRFLYTNVKLLKKYVRLSLGDLVQITTGEHQGKTGVVQRVRNPQVVDLVIKDHDGSYQNLGYFDRNELEKIGDPTEFARKDRVKIKTGAHAGQIGTIKTTYHYDDIAVELDNGQYTYQSGSNLELTTDTLKLTPDMQKGVLPALKLLDQVKVTKGAYQGEHGHVSYVYDHDSVELKLSTGDYEVFKLNQIEKIGGPLFAVGDTVTVTAGEHQGKTGKVHYVSAYGHVILSWGGEAVEGIPFQNVSKINNTGSTKSKQQPNVDTAAEPADKQANIKQLIDLGKQKGYVTYAQLNKVLGHTASTEQIEDAIDMLSNMGINVVET
jgi:ribosomal protein L24